jgi:hypothetical protein
MGKGLSPLQRGILAVLEEFEALEDAQPDARGYVSMRAWARPYQVMERLGRPPTPANRAAISTALLRLCKRGLVHAGQGEIVGQGKGYHYCLVRRAAPPTK